MNLDPLHDMQVPNELEASLHRHREHLLRLVVSLRSAGMAEDAIESSVSVLITSYKQEVILAMRRLAGHVG